MRRNEIRFRAIFENSVDAIGVSKAGIHVLANPAYLKLFGFSQNGELAGKPILNLIAPDQRRQIKENIRLRTEGKGAPAFYETRGLRKDGSEFDMEGHVSTYEMDNEIFTMAVLRDITDQKSKEKALRLSEERYRNLFDNVPVGLYLSTPAGQNLDANPALVKMLGYPDLKSYLALDAVSDYLNPEDRERWKAQMDTNGIIDNFETQVKKRDGTIVWVKNSARAIRDEDGKIMHYEGAWIDITERKLAEKALMESEERFRSLFENATIGIYRTTPEGQILLSNPALVRMLGFRSFSELARRNLEIGGYESNYPRSEFRRQIEKEGIVKGYESAWTRQDGTTIFVRESAKAIRDIGGRVLYYEGTVEDVTESRLAGLKLEESYGKLQRAMSGVVQAMASTVEWRDPYTAGHQRRVADLARAIATEMYLPEDKTEGVYMAGIIHDIGKISVPAEILSKPGSINENEFGLIKSHPKVAYEILKEIEFPWPIAEIVLQHHERLDGSGYPQALLARDILLEAKILSVADVVEAMATQRPYRSAPGIEKALDEISRKKGTLFDPAAVEACLRLFVEKRFEFK